MLYFYDTKNKCWSNGETSKTTYPMLGHVKIDADLSRIAVPKLRRAMFLKIRHKPTVGIPRDIVYIPISHVKLFLRGGTMLYCYSTRRYCTSRKIIQVSEIMNPEILKKIKEDYDFAEDYVNTNIDIREDLNTSDIDSIEKLRDTFAADLTEEARLIYYLNK